MEKITKDSNEIFIVCNDLGVASTIDNLSYYAENGTNVIILDTIKRKSHANTFNESIKILNKEIEDYKIINKEHGLVCNRIALLKSALSLNKKSVDARGKPLYQVIKE